MRWSWLVCAIVSIGCFTDRTDFASGALLCHEGDSRCPTGYSCASDQRCYRLGEVAVPAPDARVQGACAAGDRRCSASQPGVEECDGQGVYHTIMTCPFACVAASCSGECSPGSRRCGPDQTPQLCSERGAWEGSTPCGGLCNSDGSCAGDCRPGATRCTGDNQVQTCDASGVWSAASACAFVCRTGQTSCSGECAPGGKRCSGSTIQLCGADGRWADQTACGAVPCTQGECRACSDSDQQCSAGVPQRCTGGVWQDQQSSACPFLCAEGVCTGSCVPGSYTCLGDVSRSCGPDATSTDTPCPFVCVSATGQCGGACVPGSKRCSGDVSQTCRADGQWDVGQGCTGGCNAATGGCDSCTACQDAGTATDAPIQDPPVDASVPADAHVEVPFPDARAPDAPVPDARSDAAPADSAPPADASPLPPTLDEATIQIRARSTHQVRQGDTAVPVVIEGTHLSGVTGATLEDLDVTITALTDTRVELSASIPHGTVAGDRDLVVSSAAGSATVRVEVTEIYADPVLGSDGALGTPSLPFRTVTKACSAAGDHDTVHLGAGTFAAGESWPISIHDFAVTGAGAEATILSGGGTAPSGVDISTDHEIAQLSGVQISGFTSQGVQFSGGGAAPTVAYLNFSEVVQTGAPGAMAIKVATDPNVTVSMGELKLALDGSAAGVEVFGGSKVKVSDALIAGGPDSHGMSIYDGDVTLKNVSVNGCFVGVSLAAGSLFGRDLTIATTDTSVLVVGGTLDLGTAVDPSSNALSSKGEGATSFFDLRPPCSSKCPTDWLVGTTLNGVAHDGCYTGPVSEPASLPHDLRIEQAENRICFAAP